jgi:hypothetical protein
VSVRINGDVMPYNLTFDSLNLSKSKSRISARHFSIRFRRSPSLNAPESPESVPQTPLRRSPPLTAGLAPVH